MVSEGANAPSGFPSTMAEIGYLRGAKPLLNALTLNLVGFDIRR